MDIEDLEAVDLVATARALSTTISEGVPEGQEMRRLPDRVVRALTDSDLLHALRPLRHGGAESPPRPFYEAVIQIGQDCCSTAWTVAALAFQEWTLALMPPEAQDEVWQGSRPELVAGMHSPDGEAERVEGGYRLSGRWEFVTGCGLAGWWLLGGTVAAAGGRAEEQRLFLVAADRGEIVDDWHTFGLRATGSAAVRLEDVFVSEHHSQRFGDLLLGEGAGADRNHGRLYQIPYSRMISLAASVPAIGAARGSYEQLHLNAQRRRSRTGNVGGSDDPFVVRALADAHETIAMTERGLLADVDVNYLLDDLGPDERRDQIAQTMRRGSAAVDRMLQTIVDLFCLTESSVIYSTGLIQRHLRDVAVMRVHELNDADHAAEIYGRSLVALPTESLPG